MIGWLKRLLDWVPCPGDGLISAAVDVQMQPLWTAIAGGYSKSVDDLDARQKKLDELAAWARKTEDPKIRRKQLDWVKTAQYTINCRRKRFADERAAQARAATLAPLPDIKRGFPYA